MDKKAAPFPQLYITFNKKERHDGKGDAACCEQDAFYGKGNNRPEKVRSMVARHAEDGG